MANSITAENFEYSYFKFNDRQAGISLVFDHETQSYLYNVYCLETKILKELFGCEYEFLDDALEIVNSEFGTWPLIEVPEKTGCGSCSNKK